MQGAYLRARASKGKCSLKKEEKQLAAEMREASLAAQFRDYLTELPHFSPKELAKWLKEQDGLKHRSYKAQVAAFIKIQKEAKLRAWLVKQKKWVLIYDTDYEELFLDLEKNTT